MGSQFTVSPMSQKISLKAGETYEGSILVANPKAATDDFYFKVTVSPYSVKGTEYAPDFLTVSDRSRIVEWITLDTESGKLAPDEVKEIKFAVKVPESAPAGGQYAMIGVSSDGRGASEGSAIQDVVEMASLIYADVEGETRREGRILETQIPGFVASGNPVVSAMLTNEGNVHEVATIDIRVKNNLTGEVVYSADSEDTNMEVIIMPETTRLFTRELGGLPALGIFEVVENIHFMDTEMNSTAVMIICPIWFIALVFATIASVIGMICYGRHLKRKKKSVNMADDTSESTL